MGYFEDLGKIQELQKKRTREEQANEWKSKALTTLGVGAATVLAFKGGKHLLQNSVRAANIANKFVAGRAAIRNNIASKAIDDLTAGDFAVRYSAFKKGFSTTPQKVGIHSAGDNTVFHKIAQASALRKTATQDAQINFGAKAVRDSADAVLDKYTHLEKNQFNQVNNLIRTHRLHTKPKDEEKEFLNELKKHKLTEEQHKIMVEARSEYLKRVNDESYKNKQVSVLIKQQNEKAKLLGSTTQLNNRFGTAKKGDISVGDVLAHPEKFGNLNYAVKTAENELGNPIYKNVNLIDEMNKHLQTLPEAERKALLSMNISHDIKVDKYGDVYSKAGLNQLGYEVGNFVADSLPGKILNVRSLMEQSIGKGIDFTVKAGTLSPGMEHFAGGSKTGHLKHDIEYINGKAYVANDNGELIYNADLTNNYKVISNRYGREANAFQAMLGNTLSKESDNVLGRTFDFGQDKENIKNPFEFAKSKFTTQGNENYIKNQTAYVLNSNNVEEAPETYFEKADELRKYLKEHTESQFSLQDKEYLAATGNSNINKLLDIDRIQNVNEKREALHALSIELGNNPDTYNPIAEDIMQVMGNNKMAYNYSGRKATVSTANVTLNTRDWLDAEKTVGSNEFNNLSEKVNQLITHELKENNLLTKDFTSKLSENAQDIIAYSSIENAIKSNDSVLNKAFSVDEILNSEDYSQIGQYAQRVVDKYSSRLDEVHEPKYHIMTDKENPYGFMHKAWTPIDIAKDIMHGDLSGAKTSLIKNFTQFNAGRDNMHEVTAASQGAYYMLHRLNEVGEYFGLGLSAQSASNAGSLLKGIALKRILPGVIAYNQLEYFDDEVEDHTELAPSAAFASGLANIDVNARRVMDTTGVTDFLKKQYEINPIMRYWGDGGKFYNADELTDYYANGYTAVRNAPWWTFGGVNEARGGAINYWAPTFTRRMASDYYDKSLYGSNDNKWAHSLMPTLTHPFSTLNYLADPYWLEEMHKDDRPYPVSGKLFADGTPWGAILNPTIGEIIKPVKEMQPDRLRNGMDLKALIYAKLKAEDADDSQKSVLVTKTGGAEIMRQVKYSKADRNTKITSYNIQNGELMNVYTDVHKTMNQANNGPLVKMYTNAKEQIKTKDYEEQVLQNNAIVTGDRSTLGIQVQNQKTKLDPLAWYDEMKMETMASSNKGLINSLKSQFADIASDIVTKRTGVDRITRIQNKAKEIDARTKSLNADDMDDDKFDASEGVLVKDKLRNYSPSKSLDLLNDPDQINDLINAKKGDELVQDLAKSTRLITGIYGYMAGATLDFGSDYAQRIATSQNMESFSRRFWDENLGGFGGNTMEIIRRFIPDFRRHKMLNPLMNNMPDWLPDTYKFGDPFSSIERGEARLPGAGYEALNELHPDQFGDKYGAFDRFKILADIAPNSSEYKIWKEIASKTVTDPKLKEEMKEIKERRAQQGKKHDFYDYQVLGKDVDYQNITVSEIMGYGRFRSGNTIYKLAGIKVKSNDKETMQEVLGKYLHVGDTVTIATDSNEAYQKNKDSVRSTNAAVFINGESLSSMMEENGDAEKRKGDTSAAALFSRFGLGQRLIAGMSEILAHADIPILSDQWLRVRDPYEAYRAEEVYGTSYQSWEHPIDTFLMPAVERAIHDRSLVNTIVQRYGKHYIETHKGKNTILGHAMLMTNRSYVASAAIPYVLGKHELAHKMGLVGSNLAVAAHVFTGGNNFAEQAFEGGDLGWKLAKFFGAESKYGKAAGAVAGTMFASAIRVIRGNEEWKPERTKKRWAMEDYFDRLTYLKYKGLYEEAAKRAKDEEGFDVEKYVKESKKADDKAKKKQEYYQSLKDRLKRNSRNQPLQKAYLKLLSKEKNAVEEDKVIQNVGQWGRTAMLYRKAMNSTMYGLNEDSSWGEIVSALPQNDREFFMEFVKEKDPDKRQKILDTVSPQLKKALQMAWKMDLDEEETNEEYFTKHKLPDFKWAGWRPDVDMQGIEAKTIKNEGATLSDYGLYESTLDTPSANLFGDDLKFSNYSESKSTVEDNLKYILKGQGLKDVDIKVYDGIGDKSTIEAKIDSWTKDKDMQKKIKDTLKAEELKKNPPTN